jgi:hypothetical protein
MALTEVLERIRVEKTLSTVRDALLLDGVERHLGHPYADVLRIERASAALGYTVLH